MAYQICMPSNLTVRFRDNKKFKQVTSEDGIPNWYAIQLLIFEPQTTTWIWRNSSKLRPARALRVLTVSSCDRIWQLERGVSEPSWRVRSSANCDPPWSYPKVVPNHTIWTIWDVISETLRNPIFGASVPTQPQTPQRGPEPPRLQPHESDPNRRGCSIRAATERR